MAGTDVAYPRESHRQRILAFATAVNNTTDDWSKFRMTRHEMQRNRRMEIQVQSRQSQAHEARACASATVGQHWTARRRRHLPAVQRRSVQRARSPRASRPTTRFKIRPTHAGSESCG